MGEKDDLERVLRVLGEGSVASSKLLDILDTELALPNVPFPCMKDGVFWITLAEYGGWKLQQNMFTHHARILDSSDIRIAWGTINGMKKELKGE